MKAREALVLGIVLLLSGAFLYALSGVVVNVYTVSSGSYWTYYEYQYATHSEYQCVGLGVSPLCTFFYSFAIGGAGALWIAGAAMMAVSFYRLIGDPRIQLTHPTHRELCRKCGAIEPLASKYCSECATKLA